MSKHMMFLCGFALLCVASMAAEHDAGRVNVYPVVNRGPIEMEIDLDFADWELAKEILVMDGGTWDANGGTHDGDDDLSATLQVVWDAENLYFKLIVKDDEFVAQGGWPWENDGIQMAIDATAGKIPAGWPNQTTHLYNFGIADGWQPETGPFQGDAEIEMDRDDAITETQFEWRMPVEIFADKAVELTAGMEIAFAIIINDSDPGAEGQAGWVGWGNQTIVFGKNPEQMKTLELKDEPLSVDARGKLTTAWGRLKD